MKKRSFKQAAIEILTEAKEPLSAKEIAEIALTDELIQTSSATPEATMAARTGINEPEYRSRCISPGEKPGLYKDEPVSRGCTPKYIPEWIKIEVAKMKK